MSTTTSEPAGPKTVLVVDNDASVLKCFGDVLTYWGITALLAESGREAVQLFHEHVRAISMILLDVRMPGMDGPQTLSALRAINPGVRCWFVSSDISPYTVAELLEAGAIGLLPKPFRLADLRAALDGVAPGGDAPITLPAAEFRTRGPAREPAVPAERSWWKGLSGQVVNRIIWNENHSRQSSR